MDTPLTSVDGVGPVTRAVFERAGLRTLGDVYAPRDGRQEAAVAGAAREVVHEDRRGASAEDDARRCRALTTRCVTIIRRVRFAEATPVCPEHLLCPLTHEMLTDPVVAPSGYTYERWALERALAARAQDPLTRAPLSIDQVVPNRALRDALEHYHTHWMRFAVPYRVVQR